MRDEYPEVPFTVPTASDLHMRTVTTNEMRIIRSALGTLKAAAKVLGCRLEAGELALVDELLVRFEAKS